MTDFETLRCERLGHVLRVTIAHPDELVTFRSEDRREAQAVLREKRPPAFKGR